MLVPLLTIPLVALGALLRPWRVLGLVVMALATLPPFWPEGNPFLRLVLGIGAIGGIGRFFEIDGAPPVERVLRALTVVDWRTARRMPARFEARALLLAIVFGALTAGSVLAILTLRPGPLWRAWLVAIVAMWSVSEGANCVLTFATHAAGLELEPLHDQPLASRTLAEMWGKRWNLTVTRWLNAHVFQPLVRRGHPTLGVLAAFVVSALFHAYLAAAAGGIACALAMGSFFVVQGVLVIAERALHLRGRVWFFVAIFAPSPLFTEPMIAIIRPSASPLGQHVARVDAEPRQAR